MSRIKICVAVAVLGLGSAAWGQRYLSGWIWPEPTAVVPGENGSPPSDAVVLFDGKTLAAWKGGEKNTIDADGAFSSKVRMQTVLEFGDCQLHVEFASPKEVKGDGQERGNSGIGFMGGKYEVQILDSFENKTYPEGQCASVYNQRPPMVNVCRKPGEWQSFDLVFTAPRFDEEGKLTKPAYVTLFHNGVLVHNHTEVKGTTRYNQPPVYAKHPEKMPIVLMHHGNPVRFRNIWVREFRELVATKK